MTTFEYSRQLFRRSLHAFAPAALAVLLLGGCSEPVETFDRAEPTPVDFTAGLRTRGLHETNQWSKDDLLGIFMVPAGGTVSQAHTGGNNRIYEFTDPDAGTIAPMDGQPMYYPGSDKVDFIAYHYGGGSLNNNNLISLSSMKRFGWDLLYAKTENADRKSGPVNLAFSRMLGKVRVNLIKGKGMDSNDFLWLEATLSGMPGSAKVDFNTGTLLEIKDPADIEMESTTAGQGFVATLETDVLPHEAGQFTGRTISFESSRMPKRTWNIPDEDDIPAGKVRIYNLTISAREITCSSCDIRDWTTNDNGTGDATHVTNGLNIERVRIPAGTFLMGSSDGSNIGDKKGTGLNTTAAERDRLDDEIQHRVTLTRDFYMSRYEITNEQFATFLNDIGVGSDCQFTKKKYPNGLNPDRKLVTDCGDYSQLLIWRYGVKWESENSRWIPMEGYEKHPAVFITWYGAVEFAHWAGGRLPTEAEWEYACRAGTTAACYFGDDISKVNNYVIHHNNNTVKTTRPVGQKLPNQYGLYDMYGNAWEWCADRYGSYDTADVTDPTGPATGYHRVTRGGAWYNDPEYFRSAYRCIERFAPNHCDSGTGFRVVFD